MLMISDIAVIMNHQQTPSLPQPLPKWIHSSEFVSIAQRHVASKRQVVDQVVEAVPHGSATFDNVVLPLAQIEDACAGEQALIAALRYAAVDARTQHAVEEAEKIYRDWDVEFVQRSDYFALLEQVKRHAQQLDEECRRYLDKTMHLYTSNGYGLLDPVTLKQFRDTKQEIEDLGISFERNIREHSDESLRFSSEGLNGVPKDRLHGCSTSADGHVDVPLQWVNVCAITEHSHESLTRQRIYEAWVNRLKVNIPIFKRIVKLRHENAQRLGYDTYAEFKLSERVMPSITSVEKLMQQLEEHLTPASYAIIRQCERQASGKALKPWDIPYYKKQTQWEKGTGSEQIKDWFPAERTFRYMLGLLGSYFQLQFDELPREQIQQHVWAKDVGVFAVWDVDHARTFVGYLYKDLWARPLKFRGNQAVNLQPGYLRPDGSRLYPVSTIMCYLTKSETGTVPLLEHSQLWTLWHGFLYLTYGLIHSIELGHCMHDLLSRTRFSKLHGYSSPPEFVEAMGTMLENWCWKSDELRAMSCHFTHENPQCEQEWREAHPGEPLPPEHLPMELMDRLFETKTPSRLRLHLDQLTDSTFDLMCHHPKSTNDLNGLLDSDLTQVYSELLERFHGSNLPKRGYLHSNSTHLINNQDAGYYSYLVANVIAEDFYKTGFAGRHNDVNSWKRFRKIVLEPGSSRNENTIIEEFLGRPQDSRALLRALDLPTA